MLINETPDFIWQQVTGYRYDLTQRFFFRSDQVLIGPHSWWVVATEIYEDMPNQQHIQFQFHLHYQYVNSLVQNRGNPITNAQELLQSCT